MRSLGPLGLAPTSTSTTAATTTATTPPTLINSSALHTPPSPHLRSRARHLDADEAVALGAGLFAANLSTSFRLRKFGMVDLTMYGVSLSLDHVVLGDAAAAAAPEGAEVRRSRHGAG